MWLSKMRRACIFPLYHSYQRVNVGVFAHTDYYNQEDGFIGRIVLDVPRMRPGCTYDVTLPLRRSSQVYSKQQRGAIRIRCHLEYFDERRALLSYLPTRMPRFQPNDSVTVRCCDKKALSRERKAIFKRCETEKTLPKLTFNNGSLLSILWARLVF